MDDITAGAVGVSVIAEADAGGDTVTFASTDTETLAVARPGGGRAGIWGRHSHGQR